MAEKECQPPVLIDEAALARRVTELAAAISADYAAKQPLALVGVLKGVFIFMADLVRQLTVPHQLDFVAVASYRGTDTLPGQPQLILDVATDLAGRHVLLVEDIVDTGQTVSCLMQLLAERHPASLRCCSLLRKPERLRQTVTVDYVGFDIPDVWVVGYGLDYDQQYRSLPYVGFIAPSPT